MGIAGVFDLYSLIHDAVEIVMFLAVGFEITLAGSVLDCLLHPPRTLLIELVINAKCSTANAQAVGGRHHGLVADLVPVGQQFAVTV